MESAFGVINLLKKGVLSLSFIKKDGSLRNMNCTLDFNRIPQRCKPKGVNIEQIYRRATDHGILNVFDTDVQDWRSIPYNSIRIK